MTNYSQYEIVKKLIGPIQPVGDSTIDHHRLCNLQELMDLIDPILVDLLQASSNTDKQEASMKRIGMHAKSYLKSLREIIEEHLSEKHICRCGREATNQIIQPDEDYPDGIWKCDECMGKIFDILTNETAEKE